MKQVIGQTGVEGSRISLGCMRMAALEVADAEKVIATSLEAGINFIDHADIYGGGQSEERFRDAVKNLGIAREDLILQSKCGIQRGYFDFSKDHILNSVDGILKRLDTDYLDFLVLHRPDILVEPEEVAEAFSQLKQSGKVKHFGVSNQNRYQMELLQSYLDEPLAVNQLQLSPAHTPMFDFGVNVNMRNDAGVNRDSGIVEYCRLNKVTIQAWSPFQIDLGKGLFSGNPDYKELNETISRYAEQYGVSDEAIIIAWILRHPAKMQAIIGSMNPDRIAKIAKATEVNLTRPEWYDIYRSAGNVLP
ncbi:aldo/keto reductase family oxidoreductase [Streptococcus hillyeri]|uniref:Aldo/keto reductase family oxidoreductase n=1 Tax=Streptococcus hillyeri TaxID=2282420 RepID=A0A3L9DXQ3_9STRE|nr:aldo/keto reductase [Streptococcus hillyeri]RLY03590.1 aldo/keto reductase family oxidoreductase [Streptococcus hillyeri]